MSKDNSSNISKDKMLQDLTQISETIDIMQHVVNRLKDQLSHLNDDKNNVKSSSNSDKHHYSIRRKLVRQNRRMLH